MSKQIKFIIIAFLIIVVSSILIFKVFAPNPESSVETFFEGMQEFNSKKMLSVIYSYDKENNIDIENLEEDDLFTENILGYLKEKSKQIEYEIIDTHIGKDKAKVIVHTKYIDGSSILINTLEKFKKEIFTISFSDEDSGNYESNDLLNSIFMEECKNKEDEFIEKELELNLVKKDGKWMIKNPSFKVLNILLADFGLALNSLDLDFFKYEKFDLDNEEVIYVNKGEPVELAFIEVKVDSFKRTKTLTSHFKEYTIADKGNEFIVLSLSIKNITEYPVHIASRDFGLIDDKNNTYDVYEDNILSVDNYMNEREIDPGMTEQGVFSFQVPINAKGFHLIMKHDFTDEIMKLEIGE